MAWFWRKKSPEQVVQTLHSDLEALLSEEKDVSQISQVIPADDTARARESPPPEAESELRVAMRIRQIKFMFIGEDTAADSEKQSLAVALATPVSVDPPVPPVIRSLMLALNRLPFESRKEIQQVFSYLMRTCTREGSAESGIVMEPILLEQEGGDVLAQMVEWCTSPLPGIALTCGLMLRDSMRSEIVVHHMFSAPEKYVWPFFEDQPGSGSKGLLDAMKFDLASDAFATLRELLTKHKNLAKDFLEVRYVDLFGEEGQPQTPAPPSAEAAASDAPAPPAQPVINLQQRYRLYDALLTSSNYVTRRQSLKLLGELLLDRNNFTVMMKYISSKQNLKQMMNLLRDESKSIQFEAFHLFKVFVANPRKPEPVIGTLLRNQDKLIQYLEAFHRDKQEQRFLEEKSLIIETIRALQPPAST